MHHASSNIYNIGIQKREGVGPTERGLLPQLSSSWPPEERQNDGHIHQPTGSAVLGAVFSQNQEGQGSDETGQGL